MTVYATDKDKPKENVTENRWNYILKIIQENKTITTSEIAKLTGVVEGL